MELLGSRRPRDRPRRPEQALFGKLVLRRPFKALLVLTLLEATGMYTNSWDPNNGQILVSGNRGASFNVTKLPFKVGGNMPGRGM